MPTKLLLSTILCSTIVLAQEVHNHDETFEHTTVEFKKHLHPVEEKTAEHSKFTPEILVLLDSSFVNRSISDDEVQHLEIPGVVHGLLGADTHTQHSHTPYNANNGFNLNYGELILSGSVNSHLSLDTVFHFSESAVAIDEAYFTSTALEHGSQIKGGKFLSGFGYLNKQHHHQWDFADMPLVYESFLGMHGINEKGLQLQWTAPTSNYLMFGFEALQGENEYMFANTTIGDVEDPLVEVSDAPSLFLGYIKTSFDIKNTTLLTGLSYAKGISKLDHLEDESPYAFSGTSKLYGAEFVLKHKIDLYRYVTWQSEWLSRDMEGQEYSNVDTSVLPFTYTQATLSKKQSGLYSQLVYGHNKNWIMALRYDLIYQNDVRSNGVDENLEDNFRKYSAMIEYRSSELAKFRLQYNRNEALFNEDGNRQNIDTIIVQANISVGAHDSH